MSGALSVRQQSSADRETARLDLADLYLYAMRVGMHLLARGRLKRALRYLVQPVPYWRGLEYRLVWDAARFTPGDRILDIGSPKLLALYLAEKVGAEVHATDIDAYFVNEYTLLRRARGLSEQNLAFDVQDGRALTYAAASFTKVYAVSVLEHIPDEGDSDCVREIGRVLRPGGTCLVTVPFWPVSRDEYKEPDAFYWAGSSKTRADGRVFFQRRYSEELDGNPEGWRPALEAARKGDVTLLFGAKDVDHNNAVALKSHLERRLAR